MDLSPLTLISIVYWTALSAWFGGTLFVMLAAGVVHRVVRDADPTLPTVLSVNLDRQHSSLLSANVVSQLLGSLWRVSLVCMVALALAQAGEWAMVAQGNRDFVLPLVRTVLLVLAAALTVYDARAVRPKAEAARQDYVDNADEPDVANPAIERFDELQRESLLLLQTTLFTLLGLVIFTAVGLGLTGGVTFDFS